MKKFKLKPGMHDLKHDKYHAIKHAMSKGMLDRLAKSPAHYQAALNAEESNPAPQMVFGKAFHSLILEPHDFDRDVVIWNGRKAGKKWDAFKESAGDRVIFTPEEVDTLLAMQDAIESNQTASAIISNAMIEKSIFWKEKAFSNLWCKCKPDIIRPDLGILGDLKTCRDAAPDVFMKAIANYHYHWQAYWYLRGVKYCGAFPGVDFTTFVFICIEKTPPYPVATYALHLEDNKNPALEIAQEEIRQALNTYKKCKKSGVWEAYPDEIQDIYLPKWYK